MHRMPDPDPQHWKKSDKNLRNRHHFIFWAGHVSAAADGKAQDVRLVRKLRGDGARLLRFHQLHDRHAHGPDLSGHQVRGHGGRLQTGHGPPLAQGRHSQVQPPKDVTQRYSPPRRSLTGTAPKDVTHRYSPQGRHSQAQPPRTSLTGTVPVLVLTKVKQWIWFPAYKGLLCLRR